MTDIRIHTGWDAARGGDGDVSLHQHHHHHHYHQPALPSPTLTNPDMVLPTYGSYGATTSPPRPRRPPSPSYLRDKTNEVANAHAALAAGHNKPAAKRGLVGSARTTPDDAHRFPDFDRSYANTPSTIDNRSLLAPASVDEKRVSSGSSFNSDDFAEARKFLSKYEDKADETATLDNESLLEQDDTPKRRRYDRSPQLESELEARRKVQEREEQNSAMLSQRAEMILANAKKRLNLMEGNLRGARDLVAAPLTAANLKRATSLGSAHISQSSVSSRGGRYTSNGFHQEPDSVPRYRILHSQASSPTMSREYRMSQAHGNQNYQPVHSRGWSEELPERPATSLSKRSSTSKIGRFPVKINSADSPTANASSQSLRGSRSQDTLSRTFAYQRPSSREHARGKASPDPNLDTLLEDERSHYNGQDQVVRSTYDASIHIDHANAPVRGLGLYRSASAADDLRSQMTTLKGKISNLRDRAKEDSLRRASIQDLRTPSPLNNATHAAPEMFYVSSPTYGSPQHDTNAGYGWCSGAHNVSPVVQRSPQQSTLLRTGEEGSRGPVGIDRLHDRSSMNETQHSHNRTSIWSANHQSNRSVLQQKQFIDNPSNSGHPGERLVDELLKSKFANSPLLDHGEISGNDADIESADDTPRMPQQPDIEAEMSDEEEAEEEQEDYDDDDNSSFIDDGRTEDGGSVYEDAPAEQPASVAHEDREDAFDYQQFFLHSAMAAYGIRDIEVGSDVSDGSTETARGPTLADLDDDGVNDPEDVSTPAPDTPERLLEIERNLHKRTFSGESISTIATFATAAESRNSPSPPLDHEGRADWPITDLPNGETAREVRGSGRSDNGSDRADSGIGLPRRSNESQRAKVNTSTTKQMQRLNTTGSSAATARANQPPNDPAKLAVTTMLDPSLGQLGLKDKSSLFGVVEGLRRLTHQLQECGKTSGEGRPLRRKLEEIQRILDASD